MNNYHLLNETLLDIAIDLTTSIPRSVNDALKLIHKHSKFILDIENMYIALYDQHSNCIEFPIAFKYGKCIKIPPRNISWGRTDEIIKTKKTIYIKTKREAYNWYKKPDRTEYIMDLPLASWLGVPMIFNDEVIGVIATYNPYKDNFFNEKYIKIIKKFSEFSAIAINNSLLNEQLSLAIKGKEEYKNDINSQLEAKIEYIEINTVQKRPHTVFISYVKEDLKVAEKIYSELIEKGYEPWLDIKNLLPGQKREDETIKAIRESQYFIILLSKFSINKRGFIQKEIREGFKNSEFYNDSEIYIIPVRIEDIEITDRRINELQWVDLFENWKDGIDKISKSMRIIET